jgi:hypothetical protein
MLSIKENQIMIYPFLSLKTVGIAIGILLVAIHFLALVSAAGTQTWLKKFPRSREAGMVLLLVVSAWAFWLVATMDLGEFSKYRTLLKILVPAAWFLSLKFVDEFLAVRALGILLLLLAEPVFEVSFLKPGLGRLLVVILAYGWAIIGMFWVGMPFLLRDQIAWWTKSGLRWRVGCFAGIAYGLAVLASAVGS